MALKYLWLPWPDNRPISMKNAGHGFPSVSKAKADSYKPKGLYCCFKNFRALVISGLALKEVVFLNLAAGTMIIFLAT